MTPSRYLVAGSGCLLLIALLVVAGCGKPKLDVVEVEPASPTVTVGETVQFRAIARDAEGEPMAMDEVAITWSVDGESGRIDAQGRFEALAPGTVTVTAAAEEVTGNARVTVERQQVATLAAAAAPPEIQVGQQSLVTVTAQNAAGQGIANVPVQAQAETEGTTLQPSTATTGADGVAEFTLTAASLAVPNRVQFRADAVSTTATVQGLAGPPATMQLSEVPTEVTAGEEVRLRVEVRDAHGNPVPQSPVEATAVTPDTSVTPEQLETDAQGRAELVVHTRTRVGDNRVRLSVAELEPRELVIQGVAGPSGQLDVQAQPTQTVAGGTARVTLQVHDAHGNPVAGVPVELEVSPTTANLEAFQLTTDARGSAHTVLHTAIEPGENTVQARVAGLAPARATVVGNPPVAMQLAPQSTTVAMLGSVDLRAQVVDEQGNTADVVPTWEVVGDTGTIEADGTYTAARLGHDVILATFAELNAGAQIAVVPGEIAVVKVTPETATIASGTTQQFEATAYNEHDHPLDITPTWEVQNDIGTIDRSGLFTAQQAGEGAIVATADGTAGRARVIVAPGELKAITLEPRSIELQAGEEVQLQAQGRDAAGNEVPIEPRWHLTAHVGSVDASGLFQARHIGSGRIIVEAGPTPITVSIPVRVHAADLERLEVEPRSLTLSAGDAYQFSATGYDRFGNPVPVSPTWTLTEEVGSIDADGYLQVNRVGRAQVRATVDDLTGEASLVVQPGSLAALAIDPAGPLTLAAGDTVSFTVTGHDTYGNVIAVTPTWTQEPVLGSLNAEGFFQAETVGTTELVAQSDDVTAAVQISVTPGKLARIAVSPADVTVTAGEQVSFSAAGYDAYDNEVEIQPTWRLDGNLGEITASGEFTALQAHAGEVTASAMGVSGQTRVTVKPGPLTLLEVTPDSLALTAGETADIVVVGYDALGNPVPVRPTWHIDDDLGTITPDGLFTAQKAGEGRIVVAAGHLAAIIPTQVSIGKAASLQITPAEDQITSGQHHTFSVQGFDAGGNPVSVDPTWEVEGDIGTINAEGQFTATTAGSGKVVATVDTLRAAAAVQVTPGTVTALRVTPESAALVAGDRLELQTEAYDAAGNQVSARPTWTVTNQLGVVTSAGIFQARKAGSGQLIASIGDARQAVEVQVEAGPLTTISLLPATLVISAGGAMPFSAAGADAFGNPVPVNPTWSLQGAIGHIDPQQGLFKATQAGAGTVIAVDGTIAGLAAVQVEPGAVSRLQLHPQSLTVAAGEEASFELLAYDAFGNVTSTEATWALAKPLGTLERQRFKAERAGTTEVIASVGDLEARAQVRIHPGPAARLEVKPQHATMPAGTTGQFQAYSYDAYGNSQEIAALWEIEGDVGQVSDDGRFTAASQGTGKLTARSGALSSSQAEVRVIPSRAQRLVVTPPLVSIQASESQQFTAKAYDAGGNERDVPVRWAMAPDVGRLDASGKFTAMHVGTGTIVAYSDNAIATAQVEVLPGPVALLFVNPRLNTVAAGETVQFEAKGFDAYQNELPGIEPHWELLGNIGTIDPNTGQFTATQIGWGKVQAELHDQQGNADIIVTPGTPDAKSSRMVASRVRLVANGKTTANIIVLVRDQYGNPVPDARVMLVSSRDDLIKQPLPSNQQGLAIGHIRSQKPGDSVVHAVIDSQRLSNPLHLKFLEPGVAG